MKTNIEILGPWLYNRGDELMLAAITDQYGDDARLGVSSNLGLDHFPCSPNLYNIKAHTPWRQMLSGLVQGRIAATARRGRDNVLLNNKSDDAFYARGWLPERKIDMLLDSSGFAYGDSWSLNRMRIRAAYYAKLRRNGTKIVVLPQAFGPFAVPEKRAAAMQLFKRCDLIFARDEVSREHLQKLDLSHQTKIDVAPDITHLLEVERPLDYAEWYDKVAIVPSARMLDRTSDETQNNYRTFILNAVDAVTKSELEPVLVVHEANDHAFITEIANSQKPGLRIIQDSAIRLKGILGAARGVISSRYHACISSISQCTPTIGTSWSHKYELLFQDYGCSDMLLPSTSSLDEMQEAINIFVNSDARDDLVKRLELAAQRQKAEVREMWSLIHAAIEADEVRRD